MESEHLDYRRSQATAPAHGSAQSSGGIEMLKPAFSKTLFAFAAALAMICVPASARRSGGSKGGGGSHGGSSHGGSASHGGGHFSSKGASFKGSGHSYGGSRGSSRVSSARMDSGRKNTGRVSGGSYAKSGGFSSRPSGNFARNSTLGGGSFNSSAAARDFGRFGASPAASQSSRSAMGKWQSYGNSSGRSMLASARISGNAMGGGWRSFGNLSRGGGAEMSRGFGNSLRNNGPWRSFGNSGAASFSRNSSGFSSFGGSRATASNLYSGSLGFGSNHFSASLLPPSRFSSFSSFSSGRSIANFGGSSFGLSGFGASNFGNSTFGRSGFSNSGIGSGVSLIPNLFGGLLNLGTSLFGGRGILGANALSLAVRLFVSAIGATGFGQGGSAGDDIGFGQGGISGNFGLQAAPAWPACVPGAPLWAPGPAAVGYCAPYAYQPYGWSSIGYLSGPGIRFNYR